MVAGMTRLATVRMGRQPDGSFLVSSGQRIEGGSIAFRGRPIDLALHPRDEVFAVLNKAEVFLATSDGARWAQGRPLHQRGRDLGRVPRARLVARRHAALRQHQPGLRPGLLLQGWHAEVGGDGSASSPRGPRRTRSPAGWRSPATARGCSSPRPTATPSPRSTWRRSSWCASTPCRRCPTSRGSRRTSGPWSSATGAAGCRGPATGPPRARTWTSWSTTAGRRRRGRSAWSTARPARPGTSRSASTRRRSSCEGGRAYVANAMSDSISEIDLKAGTVDADDPAALGLTARARRHAQRLGPARRDPVRRRRRRQRPGRDRPRRG